MVSFLNLLVDKWLLMFQLMRELFMKIQPRIAPRSSETVCSIGGDATLFGKHWNLGGLM